MNTNKKVLGEERRELLLKILKDRGEPVTGSDLASIANVSRQVVVGDITLLKAKNEPIIATSQGYLYLKQAEENTDCIRTIACYHPPARTEEELNLLVDHGVTVRDVKIEHPIYGDLTASVMVSNRKEVQQFLEKMKTTKASYLSELTFGIHLHTISASSEQALDEAVEALRKAQFLIESTND